MEYPKINSLWKRHGWYFDENAKKNKELQEGRQSLIEGDYAEEAFGNVRKWHVQEKVDGTNIRIYYENSQVRFAGRTEAAQLPCHLLTFLQDHFVPARFHNAFPDAQFVELFGEGYGPKIQACGGNYRKTAGFILFDVKVGNWWLAQSDVKALAQQLEVPYAPEIGIMTEEEIVAFVKSKPLSRCSEIPQMMEGIIARSHPLMLFRNGKPMMWKLKCKEFQ
jgi:ATP-dependent RNA circularization protein (DNA/RNA ligase family)